MYVRTYCVPVYVSSCLYCGAYFGGLFGPPWSSSGVVLRSLNRIPRSGREDGRGEEEQEESFQYTWPLEEFQQRWEEESFQYWPQHRKTGGGEWEEAEVEDVASWHRLGGTLD